MIGQAVVLAFAFVAPMWLSRGSLAGKPIALLAVAAVVAIAGSWLVLGGFFSLGRNLSVLPRPRDDSELVRSGAYRFVRHPIYGGLILLDAAVAVISASIYALICPLLVAGYLYMKARREEAWLQDRYSDYAEYRAHTRMLIPFLF